MDLPEFLRLNAVIIGIIFLGVFLYLLNLINKRRKEKFLHKKSQEDQKTNNPS